MCLGIPGRVVAFLPDTEGQLALVDVLGAEQAVNVGMLEDTELKVGDHIVIHMGFAMSKVSEAEAQEALSMLEMLGRSPDDEPAAGWGNR
jgi:hydrogenase expression/formation protein HypC